MYLRTTRRKNKYGSTVTCYQLAHNVRHPDTRKPVAHIIQSFGHADELDRDQLVLLCRSIAQVCGLNVVDTISDSEDTRQKDPLHLSEDVKLIQTVALSCVLVIEALWERLGIGKELRNICGPKR